MAGGGSVISLPLLIFLGLDSPLANGTNRLAIFIQTISSMISFKMASRWPSGMRSAAGGL